MKAHIVLARLALLEGQGRRITSNVLGVIFFSLLFTLLFRFIVPSFGLGLEFKQGRFNAKGEET